MGHLQLFFKVGEHAQAAQHNARAAIAGVGNGQPAKAIDLNIAQMLGGLPDLGHALLGREQRLLVGVAQDGDDGALEQSAATLDDIEMAEGDRVEAPRIDRNQKRGWGQRLQWGL